LDPLYLFVIVMSSIIEISFHCALWITLNCHWFIQVFFDTIKVDFQAPVLLAWGLFLQQCAQVSLCFSLVMISFSLFCLLLTFTIS
jgi:hypothetical protein